ncbi:MAG: amino acid adenylation domain-containing protein [Prevotella sp.]|nr:amino acid adenylation domain-containing protein [Prevotella sp.]
MNTIAPLTKVQYGIYAECIAHQGEVCYNLPYLYILDGSLDEEKLKAAVESSVAAHPTLFTRIKLNEQGDPQQTIDDSETFSLQVEQIADIEVEKQTLVVPFDIYNDRLFHIRLLKDTAHFYLLLDIHHLISDGITLKVMLADVEAAYNGKVLEAEAMTMQEVALAEDEKRKTPAFEEARQWYAQNFDCGDTFTQLIPDLDEPERSEASLVRVLDTDTEKVEAFCKANGIYKNTLFTAAYAYLLAKFNNEQESLFTTVYNGRTDQQFLHSVGMTVKTLPVYTKFTDETSVLDFLMACQTQITGCRDHDIYAYSDLMADLNLQSNSMFAWRGNMFDDTQFAGKPMQTVQLRNLTLEMSLCLMVFSVGNQYHLKAEYKSNEYSEMLISQFMESYEAVLEGFLAEANLCDINITTTSQMELLDSFNQNDVPYDTTQTIVSLFRQQAKATPDNIAVVYKDKRITYAEVDRMSDRIAGYIASKGLGEEDVVSVLISRSEWMTIASLGVQKAGCAYQPLDPTYPKERLNFMMQDANAKLLIADEDLCPIVDEYKGDVILTKALTDLPDVTELPEGPKPSSLFIMLYTSGSTGVPKGCQLTNGNLVAFIHWYHRYFDMKAGDKVTAYASYGFDANMYDMYPALTCGATVYIIPEELRLDLMALNDYFEKEHITNAFMTTQVAYQFVTSIENHSLKHLSTGGEKLATLIPPKGYKMHNAYGPTETTILETCYQIDRKMKNIPIGKAVDNMRLYIVDPQGHRLPIGAAGELWASGPQVSRGYLNRPEKTAEVYIPNPFAGDSEKYARIYRTGDIVRYLPSGDIEFVGRKDGQVKIRGFRIELKEVEAVIREFPAIKDATVQAFDEEGGGKFIAAYVVSDEQVDIEALNNFILDQKPPYMVPAVTMQIDAIPLNQNQKVNKKALPKPEKKAADVEVDTNVPMNVLEKEIHGIIAQIINTEDFGVTTILGYVGLTSIMAIKLAIQINKRFGVTLDSKALAKTGSVQSIENEILTALLSGGAKQEGAETAHADMSNIPLSYAQMGVYVDSIKNPESTIYNTPVIARFPKDVDINLLTKAAETLVKTHPMLQAHFGSAGAEIIQTVDLEQPVEIVHSQCKEEDIPRYKWEFVKPFNLRQGPLYRMEIVTTGQWVYLMMDIHHLVVDGGSFDVLLSQLFDLLNGKEIEPETFTYADFVAAQKADESSEEFAAARTFFQTRLGNVEGVTEVPSDLTNPREQGTLGTLYTPLDFTAIDDFCRQHNVSPAHHILAATFYALSRFTNNEQLCITTISNGRSDLRISNTVGMFVNTLALSATIGEQSVMEFINETSRNFDETLQHETYPFTRIASDYDLTAEIMFAYQMGVIDDYKYKGETIAVETFESDTPKFRIAFFIMNDESGRPSICLQYDKGRYSQELMACLAQSISNAAKGFISNPAMPLKNVSLLDTKQVALLDSFNQNDVDYDHTQTVVSLFRRQVELHPDNIAMVYHDIRLTYRQVDEQSERIAQYVQSQGLGSEDVVSILIPRSEWMVVASMGVLKAGCAYQPLDPSYPAERLNFMMQDANARLLIADEELRPIVDEYQGKVLLTKDIDALPAATAPVKADITPSSLFIMLYTSGSTGMPKGCQLEHGNLVCFCHWYHRYYDLKPEHKVAAYASYGFDACMMDMYSALTCGAAVYIIGEDIRLNLPDLNDYFNREGITHSFMTTQVGCQFAINFDNHSLRHLSVGGEKVLPLTPPTAYQLHNGYGPTECTIFTTIYPMKEFEQNAPIGKPLDNLRLYIVDKQLNRLPVGAVGELWVSGPQVSRGYLNRPEKTAETYLTNPFTTDAKYSRVYRTGDIVRYLSDGNIQFVGRRDGQVKIRGFRIELKEVEAVIREFPGISDATVQAFDYETGGKFIAAYIVSDGQVDIQALNAFIGKQKPSYMIPAATMQIDSIPLNQNQKVNRKALPAPVIQAADHEYVEPKNEQERLFANIFGDILSMDKVSATDNFFELGGTSLMVTKVIIECDKAGYHVIYGDVFTHPTPRLLAQFVSGEAPVEESDVEITNFDYTGIDAILKRNNIETFLKGERQQLGHVLLTGATGYLGIHVLRELIASDATTITCLVRGKDQPAAEHRLKNLLFYYFEKSFKELFGSRLFVVNGDVTQEISVDRHIDTVFNCAANVKHFSKGTDIEDVNIGGAQRCVEFCLGTGARLVHISTTSVGEIWIIHNDGEQVPMLDERKLWFGQFLDNRYISSKFLAERAVLDAVARHGLSAKVMRVGNLAPRSYDGEFQANFNSNSYMGRLKVFHVLGCCPYDSYDELTEMSPIDQTAQAVVTLASTPKECTVFQPFNNHTELLGDVLQLMTKVGREIRFVETAEFEKTISEAGQDPEKAKMLSAILAYQDVAHGQKAAIIERDNRYTCNVLHRLGFHWRDTSWDYVERMLTAIGGFGFFE